MEPSIRPFTICWEKMAMPSISRPAGALCPRSEHHLPDHGLMRHFAAEWREAVKVTTRGAASRAERWHIGERPQGHFRAALDHSGGISRTTLIRPRSEPIMVRFRLRRRI